MKLGGGLTKSERKELKEKGEDAVLAHLEAARLDPELAQFRETTLEEYDNLIAELSANKEVLDAYKNRFSELKETLARVVSYEHLRVEEEAVAKAEEKLRKLYEEIGKAPGPIERKKLTALTDRRKELKTELQQFDLDPNTIDMIRRREVRRMQNNLKRYSFAETESRQELIREVLPDLLQGAPALFQGETGSGKSQLAKYISLRYLDKNPELISVQEQIKESQIIGKTELKEGATEYIYSSFVKSMKEGCPVILDEVNRMPGEFASILHEIYQLRVGDSWKHPVTGEKIEIKPGFVILATANLKSKRYRNVYDIGPEVYRRFIAGAGAKEIHYLDIGKENKEKQKIAPETLKILAAVLANRHGDIAWDEKEAPQKAEELKKFVTACRQIQEDFTWSLTQEGDESFAREGRYTFKELVITLKDQIEIMKAWKASEFREPLDSIVLKEFFHKAEISGRPAKDRENMVKIFIANKLFQDTKPEDFKIQGLSIKAIRQWQGKE